jgi:hypothetical protein
MNLWPSRRKPSGQPNPGSGRAEPKPRVWRTVFAAAALRLRWRWVVRIGPAGWQYRDWAASCPKPKPRGFDELSFIASFFNTIEINSSFYGPRAATPPRIGLSGSPQILSFGSRPNCGRGLRTSETAPRTTRDYSRRGWMPSSNPGRLGEIAVVAAKDVCFNNRFF